MRRARFVADEGPPPVEIQWAGLGSYCLRVKRGCVRHFKSGKRGAAIGQFGVQRQARRAEKLGRCTTEAIDEVRARLAPLLGF